MPTRLSENFTLEEDFPGWESATPAEVEGARRTAVQFLQPIRNAFGPVVVTSWLRSTGSGAHLDPETVDFVPVAPGVDIAEVHAWATRNLAGRFGELLLELPTAGESTRHIHRTRPGVGGWGESLVEGPPGQWRVVPAWELPPIDVTVGGRSWWWLIAGAAIYLARRR